MRSPLTSPPALRAYLTTVLAILTTIALLLLSSIAYIVFYYQYVPSAFIEKDIPLQYTLDPSASFSPNIHALIPLHGEIRPDQPYDVHVLLEVPTSEWNSYVGNFMVSADVFSATSSNPEVEPTKVLEVSKTGLLTYRSPLITTFRTLLFSPAYLFGLAKEAEMLDIPLLSSISFPAPPLSPDQQKWHHALNPPPPPYPTSIKLAIFTSQHQLRVYTAKLRFVAKLKGLRWWMYHHRLISFVVFAGVFFLIMACATAGVWWVVVAYLEKRWGLELGAAVPAAQTGVPAAAATGETGAVAGEDTGLLELSSDVEDDDDDAANLAFDGRRIKREDLSSLSLSESDSRRKGSKSAGSRLSMTPGKKPASVAGSSSSRGKELIKSDSDSPSTIKHTPTSSVISASTRRGSAVDDSAQTENVLVVETMDTSSSSESGRTSLATGSGFGGIGSVMGATGGRGPVYPSPAPTGFGDSDGEDMAEDEKEGGALASASGAFQREGGTRRRSSRGGN